MMLSAATSRGAAFHGVRSAAAAPCVGLRGRGGVRRFAAARAPTGRRGSVAVVAEAQNPLRAAISGVVSGIYKATGSMATVEPGASPLWAALARLDLGSVRAAISAGADLNERNGNGDTPLLMIAREGHYKYPPAEIPRALCDGGADLEATDKNGMTALQVSLLSGWQNISYELLRAGASTGGVPSIKSRLTCPDCKRLVAERNL